MSLLVLSPHLGYGQVSVAFNSDFVEICAPGVIQLTDNSSSTAGPITQWEWKRDGIVFSNLQHPGLFFNTPGGSYQICLTVTDALGNSDSLCINNYITAYNSPIANFSADNLLGCTPLAVNFTDSSLLGDAPIQEWRWDFGDGTIDTINQHPSHVYTSVGNFDVTLVVIDSNGCSHSLLMSNLITVVNSVSASIIHNAYTLQCGLPASVTFNAAATNPPGTSYTWYLGDNSTGSGLSLSHNYLSAGCFSPTLTVSNGLCSSTATVASCISVSDAPTANFTITNPTSCVLPYTPILTNQSTGLTALSWSFGDGGSSSLFQPSHTYTNYFPEDSINYLPGVFPIILTTSNQAGCTATDTQLVYISNLNAAILGQGVICAPDTTGYNALAQNVSNAFYAVNWVWNVDGGIPSSTNSILAYYPDSGIYNVQVTITDNIGCVDSAQRIVPVGIVPVIDSVTTDTNFVCRLTGITFTGEGSSYIDQWIWTFNDTTSALGQQIYHHFGDTGYISGNLIASFRDCTDQIQLDSFYIFPPIARFESQIVCDSFLVNFMDESIGGHRWFWDFGDTTTLADSSNLEDPSYVYPGIGSYNVVLIVYNDLTNCVDTFKQIVNIGRPTSDFTISDSLCTQAIVTPVNLSTGALSWHWSAFGSLPFTDISEAPTFIFNNPGIFPVTMTSFDINGCSHSLTKQIHIAGVDTNIVHSPIPACRPATVNFVDSSVGILSPITNWLWSNGSTLTTASAVYVIPGPQTMTLTVTNDWGCSFPVSEQVDLGGLFINFSASQDICIGNFLIGVAHINSPSNANGFPPYTFVWDYGDGHRDTTSNPVTNYLYTTAGVYDLCLYVIDSIGCVQELCRPNWVEVHDPTSTFTADTFFSTCPPLEVEFSNLSLSGTQWAWAFGDGSISNLENPTHVYSTPGFYNVTLEVISFPGCSNIDTIVQMIQISGPTGNFIMPPATSCAPFSTEFTASGSDIESYTWLFGNGDFQTNITNASTDTTSYTYTQEGAYVPILVMSDSFGCQIPIEQDTIFIHAPPSPTFSSDSLICQLDSIHYQVLTPITSNMSVEWIFEGGFPDSSVQLNPSIYYPDTGSFDVQLIIWEDGCSDTLTRNDYIQIKSYPISNFGINISDTCAPAFVQFSDSSSTEHGSIQSWAWDFGNGQSSNSQDSALWYNLADTFDIQLIVENNYGCIDTIVKTIQSYPTPNVDAGAYPNVCIGDTVQLLGAGNASFNWSSSAWVSDSTIASPLTVLDSSHQYILEVYNAFGCQVFDTTTIIADSLITVNAGDSLEICLGETVTLQASGNTSSYDWGTSPTLSCQFCVNPIATPTNTSTYYLQPATALSCANMDSVLVTVHPLPIAQIIADSSICMGDSLQLLASGGQNYTWLSGSNLSNSSIPNPIATPNSPSTYMVEVVDSNNCKDSISITINIRSTAFTPLPDITICRGDSATLGLINTSNPSWSGDSLSCSNCSQPTVNPYDSSLYIIQYYNSQNCPIKDSLIVNVLDLTNLQALYSDTICSGDSVQLSVLGNNGADVTWLPNYALSANNISNPIAFPAVDTHYVVQVIQGQCSANDSLFIKIEDVANINAIDASYCIGDSAHLLASGNVNNYQWSPNTNLSDDSIANPLVTSNISQQYQVIGHSFCGSDTAYANVDVNGYPTMQLDSSAQGIIGTTIQLNSNSNLSNIFAWSPSDELSCVDCPNPSWIISGDATFYVTVTNSFGCSILDSITINSSSECLPDLVFVPNAFTPDLDGHNDILYLRSGIIQKIKTFQIYSRWGQLLFETTDMLEGWDGSFQGKALAPDVFGYFVIFQCPTTGEEILKKGNVTILR